MKTWNVYSRGALIATIQASASMTASDLVRFLIAAHHYAADITVQPV